MPDASNILPHPDFHPEPAHPEPVEGHPPRSSLDQDLHTPPEPIVPPRQRFGKAVEFVRLDLNTKLWGKQAEILRVLKFSKRTAVRSCNGSGKTHVAAVAVIWWLMAHEHKSALAITTAPTQRQVTNLLWREIRSIYFKNTALFPPSTKLTRTSLELSPNHYAMGLSTDSPERFQGFHEENILFVVDEASGVHEDVFEAIEGSMTSRRARLLLIGNPTSVSGTFYKAFHQNRTQYEKIHISAFDTPNLRTRITNPDSFGTSHETETTSQSPQAIEHFVPEIPGIIKPAWVRDAELTWGINSTQYQVRVLGEFPIDADDTLIPLRQIEAAISNGSDPTPAHRASDLQSSTKSDDAARPSSLLREGLRAGSQTYKPKSRFDRDARLKGEMQRRPSAPRTHGANEGLGEEERQPSIATGSNVATPPDLTAPIHIGVDVARFGTDRTVICIRQGNHVIALTQHQKLNTMRTTGLVVKAIDDYNPQIVRIDEIGIGAGVVDRLHELNYSQVEGINVGNKATDPEHFFNLRSELYDALRARFEEQTIVIPNDDDLIGQLAAIRVEYTSRGQLKIEPKETMRRRSLPSPDKADALLLAFAPTAPKSLYRVWT